VTYISRIDVARNWSWGCYNGIVVFDGGEFLPPTNGSGK